MVGTEHPQVVGEQLLEGDSRTCRIPRLAPPRGEIVSHDQGVGVVGTEHPQEVGEQLLQGGGRTCRIPRLPPPRCEAGPGNQGDRAFSSDTGGQAANSAFKITT
jgi:hypothetical protein